MRTLLLLILLTPLVAFGDQIIRQSGSDWIVQDIKPGGFFAGVAAAKKAQAEQDAVDAQRLPPSQQLSPSDWEKLRRTKEFLRGIKGVEYSD